MLFFGKERRMLVNLQTFAYTVLGMVYYFLSAAKKQSLTVLARCLLMTSIHGNTSVSKHLVVIIKGQLVVKGVVLKAGFTVLVIQYLHKYMCIHCP